MRFMICSLIRVHQVLTLDTTKSKSKLKHLGRRLMWTRVHWMIFVFHHWMSSSLNTAASDASLVSCSKVFSHQSDCCQFELSACCVNWSQHRFTNLTNVWRRCAEFTCGYLINESSEMSSVKLNRYFSFAVYIVFQVVAGMTMRNPEPKFHTTAILLEIWLRRIAGSMEFFLRKFHHKFVLYFPWLSYLRTCWLVNGNLFWRQSVCQWEAATRVKACWFYA